MHWEPDEIERVFRNCIESLRQSHGDEFAARIAIILDVNRQKRRVDFFLQDETRKPADYVDHVVTYYTQFHSLVRRLQIERDEAEWEALYRKLFKWSYGMVANREFSGNWVGMALACTAEAAIAILNAQFTYDTEFDAWARVIAQNTVRAQLRKDERRSRSEEQAKTDDGSLAALDALLMEAAAETNRVELQYDLHQAINQLSLTQKEVIRKHYFESVSLADIAKQLGITPGAVHKRHFDALKKLGKILGDEDHNKG